MTTRYAQIIDGSVANVIESDTDPDGINGSWVACGDAGPGWQYVDGKFLMPGPVVIPQPTRMTKDAFQARFPKSADGISSKYDLLMLFLADAAYSEFLVPDSTARFGLKALVMAAKNKMDRSASVDLAVPDAAMFTGLLAQPSMPTAFRLTAAERNAILHQSLLDTEVFK